MDIFFLVMWNFLDQCFSNLNVHTNLLCVWKVHRCSVTVLVSPGCCVPHSLWAVTRVMVTDPTLASKNVC